MADGTTAPSWRDALFGEDTVANLRCAVKYVFWQVTYLLLATIELVFGAVTGICSAIISSIPSKRVRGGIERIADGFGSILTRIGPDRIMLVMMSLASVVLIGSVGLLVGLIVWLLYIDLLAGLQVIGVLAGSVLLGLLLDAGSRWLDENEESVVEMRGIRRLYGRCPVSMDIEPGWYDKYIDR